VGVYAIYIVARFAPDRIYMAAGLTLGGAACQPARRAITADLDPLPCSTSSTCSLEPPSWAVAFSTAKPATDYEATIMTIDYTLGAIVIAGLFVYLVYALIRPEKF
jgi:K+-transporting ATPase KdpF subunit